MYHTVFVSCYAAAHHQEKETTEMAEQQVQVKAGCSVMLGKRPRQRIQGLVHDTFESKHPRSHSNGVCSRIKVVPMRGKAKTKAYEETLKHLQDIVGPEKQVIELDVTSKTKDTELRKLSPFYPVGDIPVDKLVPDLKGETSKSVEGLWQGLKVFEKAKHDPGKFTITTMKNLKRSSRKFGRVLGHYQGASKPYLNYAEARRHFYIPAYRWALSNRVKEIVKSRIVDKIKNGDAVILRDFNSNGDPDVPKVLSHAQVLKQYALELTNQP